MKNLLSTIVILLFFGLPNLLVAQPCQGGIAQYLLNTGDVNVRVNTTGNLWWDGSDDSGYEFPANSGKHLLFSGGLWMGGKDANGNLKLAAQSYGASTGNLDYFPGPLDPETGSTNDTNCFRWDRIFEANRLDNFAFVEDYNNNGQIDDPIPASIQGWPARGNALFESLFGFPLPDQNLAPFVDRDGDNVYEPTDGDYPKIKGTKAVWWVYNDNGNTHTQTNAIPLKMEIQVMAYVYNQGNDLIKNATFYDYKMIHYGEESIFDYYTSLWVDPDIGCSTNDYIGCHPASNLAYAYNGSFYDPNCNGALGYEFDIPMVGVKILNNNTTDDGMMTGFSYYFNGGQFPQPLAGTTDPETAPEFYNYMSGLWANGNPLTQGGDGFEFTGGEPYPFAFDNSLINGNPWTECSANVNEGDRRFLMNFGPTTLFPGSVQQLNFAVVTKKDAVYPCPEVDGIIADTDFVASFDSLQTVLADNTESTGPFAAFDYETASDGQTSFSDRSFYNPDQWEWDFGDGNTATGPFAQHTYNTDGNYTVTLTVSNSIGTDTYSRNLNLSLAVAPEADFNANVMYPNVIFENLTVNNPIEYLWDFGDGNTSALENVVHTYTSQAVYEVCLTASNEIGSSTICKDVDLSPVATDNLSSRSFKIYPNPVRDYLFLDFAEPISPHLEIRFFDLLGRKVTPTVDRSGSKVTIGVQKLPRGLYFFELMEDGANVGNGKFLVD